jgi:hypothetical protein
MKAIPQPDQTQGMTAYPITDFHGSARRRFTAESRFRWKTPHRTDGVFEHVAAPPFATCGSELNQAQRA